jgi:hypothetical protein
MTSQHHCIDYNNNESFTEYYTYSYPHGAEPFLFKSFRHDNTCFKKCPVPMNK